MGPQALPYPDQIGYAMDRMVVDACQERSRDEPRNSTLGLLQSNGKQDALLTDRTFVLVVSVLALAMAVVFVLGVMPYA
jgi:hypothetical protein